MRQKINIFSDLFIVQVIKKVMKMDAAVPFNTPVDPVALGIPVSTSRVIIITQVFDTSMLLVESLLSS